MNTFSLSQKNALITGASRRLGAAGARAHAAADCSVVLHYNHSAKDAEALASEIRAQGGKASCIQADLAEPAQVESLIPRAVAQSGPLDILINNASIFRETDFSETTASSLQENIAVHATAPLLLSRAFAAQQRCGAILNMVDARIADYDQQHVPYHLSKRMLADLTRIMAVEFAPRIRVNGIAPGLILPPEGKDETYLKGLAHTNLLQSFGAAQDIVDAGLYLLSAAFVTGEILYVDGGRNLRGKMYD